MTRLCTLLILSMFVSFAVSAQQMINGFVEDDETGNPVSYASVTPEKGDGIMTDSLGKFSLVVRKQSRLNDSLIVTAVGYSSRKVKIRDLLTNHKVKLSHANETLEQVKVFSSLTGDYRRFGYYREWKAKNEGGEIGYVFDLPARKILVDQIQVKINHNYDTCWLKLHIRDVALSGFNLPENEILKKEFVLPVTLKYGLVEFDLNWEPITTPTNQIYVGFELLRCGCSESTAPSFFFMGNEQGLNFYKQSEKSVWERGGEHTIYVRMITK